MNYSQGTMRLVLKWSMGLASLIVLSIVYRLIFKDIVDYTGMAWLITALAGFIVTIVAGKSHEKREERKEKENVQQN